MRYPCFIAGQREKDDNYIFTISQWYPRLCVYSDVTGWQNKQFTGRGEFALTFGNFEVNMTLPDDYVVGSTGECQNYEQMLTKEQFGRWKKAQTGTEPVEVVTESHAAPEGAEERTWHPATTSRVMRMIQHA